MGSFANTLFSILLGWVQNAVSWLWQLAGSDGAGGMMAWVLDHWLLLVILLCAAGVVIDLVVYLIRWQPYRVWRSFWQRVSGKDEEELEAEDALPQVVESRRWLYADGSTEVETPQEQSQPEVHPGTAVPSELPEMQLKAPVRPVRRVIPARRRRAADGSEEYLLHDLGGEKQAYHQPYYPPQWSHGEQKTIDEGDNA